MVSMYEFDREIGEKRREKRGFRALLRSFIDRPWYSRLLLSFIFVDDVLDYKDLMESVESSYSSISKMLDSLVEDGLVVKERGVKKYYFYLTREGHELVKYLLDQIDKLIETETVEVEGKRRQSPFISQSTFIVKYARVVNPDKIGVFAPYFNPEPLLKRLGYRYDEKLGWVKRLK